jgi:hypothetical protein
MERMYTWPKQRGHAKNGWDVLGFLEGLVEEPKRRV